MRILAFGTYDLRSHPRMAVLIEGLRVHGDQVVEVNAPLGLDTAARVAILRQPWRLPLLAVRLAQCWLTLTTKGRRAVREHRPDAVLVGYLGHFDVVLARLLFRRTPIVLDHLIFAADTAADRGVHDGPRQALLRWIDLTALRSADVIVVDTAEHAAMLPDRFAPRGVIAAVGASASWFEAGAAQPADSALVTTGSAELKVVFFGLFTPLQGTDVIGAALGMLADEPRVRVTMIGQGQDLDVARRAARANQRIEWREWVPAPQLPAVVAAHDVCLGIFGAGAKAQRVVPNKVFQGAAAACALITSDTAPQRRSLGDAALFVPPGEASALAGVLVRLAHDPAQLADLRRAARRVAQQFTPEAVVVPLRTQLLDLANDSRRTPVDFPPLSPRAWLRYDLVSRIVERLAPAGVLELGCGQGGFGARLAARGRYLGVEPDATSAAVAAARIERAGGTLIVGDHTALPVTEQHDLVCAFEVLEHIEDDVAALADWVQLVRPGGHLLISVPAWPDRFGPMDVGVGHFRRYRPEALEKLLIDAGLVDTEVTVYGWPLGYALEALHNPIARRKLTRGASSSPQELTAASARVLQPAGRWSGAAVRWGTLPFRHLQRLTPGRGIGLVAVARRPVN